jgi:hypothetical protein
MDLEYLYFLFKIVTLMILLLGFAYLLALSIIVRDVQLIKMRPFLFAVELLGMAVLPGLPLLFFVVSRNISWKTAWIWFVSLSVKFAIIHVLLEISGTYRWLFT